MSSNNNQYGIVDDSQWPIVHVKLIGSPANYVDLQQLFQNIDSLYERDQIFVVIIDLLQTDCMIYPSYIYELVKHMKKMTFYTTKYIACLCLVVDSYPMSQTIEWVKSLRKPTIPWHLFPTMTDANKYIADMQIKAIKTN